MFLINAFSCYLSPLVTLNIFVVGKCRIILELCRSFNLFLSTSGVVSVKTNQKLILGIVYVFIGFDTVLSRKLVFYLPIFVSLFVVIRHISYNAGYQKYSLASNCNCCYSVVL